MGEWIHVDNELPKPFEVVWIYYRGREILFGCKTDIPENCDSTDCWYSFDYEKGGWTYWWKRVDANNLDKPNLPK